MQRTEVVSLKNETSNRNTFFNAKFARNIYIFLNLSFSLSLIVKTHIKLAGSGSITLSKKVTTFLICGCYATSRDGLPRLI